MKKLLCLFFLLGVMSCEKEDDDDYGSDNSYSAAVELDCFKNA